MKKYKIKVEYKKYLAIGVIMCAIIGLAVLPHFNRNTYTVIITDKEIKRFYDSDKYLIYTQLANDKIIVFENTDTLLERKFNAADIYGSLKVNKQYDIEAYGWRIPYLSIYENIVEIKRIY